METNQEQSVVESHIQTNADIRSGKPHVKGTRITVADVVLWSEQGMSPDQLILEFPQLSLADVYASLAYYHDNQQLIDKQIEDSEKFVSEMKLNKGSLENNSEEK